MKTICRVLFVLVALLVVSAPLFACDAGDICCVSHSDGGATCCYFDSIICVTVHLTSPTAPHDPSTALARARAAIFTAIPAPPPNSVKGHKDSH